MSKIPKTIHFCWFGEEEYPEVVKKCINSWKEKLPDYQIKCWNSLNFDVNICQYTKEAFQVKKYAFVSDYVRLYALYSEGGIYLDTDVEVLKSFNDILDNMAFAGFEKENHAIATCVLGSEKGNLIFKDFLDYYINKPFILKDNKYDLTPNPVSITSICKKHGLCLTGNQQKLDFITIYPQDYFCPYNRATEELHVTKNTYSIHYFNASWISDNKKKIVMGRKRIIKKYGKIAGYIYYGFNVLIKMGFKQFVGEFLFFTKK